MHITPNPALQRMTLARSRCRLVSRQASSLSFLVPPRRGIHVRPATFRLRKVRVVLPRIVANSNNFRNTGGPALSLHATARHVVFGYSWFSPAGRGVSLQSTDSDAPATETVRILHHITAINRQSAPASIADFRSARRSALTVFCVHGVSFRALSRSQNLRLRSPAMRPAPFHQTSPAVNHARHVGELHVENSLHDRASFTIAEVVPISPIPRAA